MEASRLLQPGSPAAPGYGAAGAKEGLSSSEAAKLLEEYGPNELEATGKKSFLEILMLQMGNLFFLLTITASIICYATSDPQKGTFLFVLVCVVCLANAIGEYSGQDASAALREMSKSTNKSKVVRDGKLQDICVADIVPGDVVHVGTGDVIPADMQILECVDLQANEAVLTGESSEADKSTERKPSDTAFHSDMLYKSTEVVAGTGRGIVKATGMQTQVGLIAKRLKPQAGAKESELNPLQRSINVLGQIIGGICLVVIIIGCVLAYALDYQGFPPTCRPSDIHCRILNAVIQGLLLAVLIVPHGLPLVVMVMLRIGSQQMAARNAVVTKQSAVDYLGATNVICTDKTGTLTEGKMAAASLAGVYRDGGGAGRLTEAAFYPLRGLDPRGGVYPRGRLTDAAKRGLDRGAPPGDLPDLADPKASVGDSLPAALVARTSLAAASINCHATTIKSEAGVWKVDGNMSEAALKVAAYKGKLEDGGRLAAELAERYPRVTSLEVPFSSKRKMSATVHEVLPTGGRVLGGLALGTEHTHVAILKGAPDRLLPHLGAIVRVDGERLLVDQPGITEEERKLIQEQNATYAQKALRSLLMAVRPLSSAEAARLTKAANADERLELLKDKGPLAFLSMWGIFDPPRSSVPPSIRMCHEAGIRVVMITGDQRATAVAIGELVGIVPPGADKAVVVRACAELHEGAEAVATASLSSQPGLQRKLSRSYSIHERSGSKGTQEAVYKSTEEIEDLTAETCGWSRAQPTDKVAIVESLVKQGNVSAMTGDGVNDAPALKHADIGVSMGIAGTAVTKNCADMILMDDNFSTIVDAVAEGRKIYGNVQKYVVYNISVKAGECLMLLAAIVAGVPPPIAGLLTLVNLIATHIIPPMSLAWEDAEWYTMRIPPRDSRRDLVLNRVHILYRWLPFILCYMVIQTVLSCLWVWQETGFFTVAALAGSTAVGAIRNEAAACEIAGNLDKHGGFIPDTEPYHCKCYVRSSPWQVVPEVVEQWGVWNSTGIALDPFTGATGTALDRHRTPFAGAGGGALLEPCGDGHLCWRKAFSAAPPLIPSGLNCADYGTRIGTSMAYVGIQVGEVLTLMTYRTDAFFGWARFSPQYTCCLAINLAVLFCVLYIKPLEDLLLVAPLTFGRLALACIAAVLLVTVSEVIKVLYRFQLKQEHAILGVYETDTKDDEKV